MDEASGIGRHDDEEINRRGGLRRISDVEAALDAARWQGEMTARLDSAETRMSNFDRALGEIRTQGTQTASAVAVLARQVTDMGHDIETMMQRNMDERREEIGELKDAIESGRSRTTKIIVGVMVPILIALIGIIPLLVQVVHGH